MTAIKIVTRPKPYVKVIPNIELRKWGYIFGNIDDQEDLAERLAALKEDCIQLAASDELTNLTAGSKITFRMPYDFTLTEVRASLTEAQASGSIFTIDINRNGTSILSTKLTINNTEKTSKTASVPAIISDSVLGDDDEIRIDIVQVGTPGAKGLKITLIGLKS